MHELVVNDWLDHDYIDRHTDGWPALRERALRAGRRSAPPPTCGIGADEVRELARDYGTTRARGDPPELRHAARARRRQRGARWSPACPASSAPGAHRAGGLLLSARGWVQVRTTPRCSVRTCSAGRTPRTINMSTIGDDLLREASPRSGRGSRPDRLQQQSGGGRAANRRKVARGFRARGPVHRRARAFPDRHRRLRRLRAAGDDAARALRRAHELWPHLPAGQRAGDRAAAARRGPTPRSSASSRARMGFTEPCFADSDEAIGAQALRRRARRLRRRCGATAGCGWPSPDAPFAARRLPDAERPRASSDAPEARASPDYVPPYESRSRRPELAARYPLAMISPPARNFLNSSFVNVKSLRSIEGEPLLEIHPQRRGARAASSTAATSCASSTTAANTAARLQRQRAGARPASSSAWASGGASSAPAGTNVNELTHQRLTDIGRGADVLRLPGGGRGDCCRGAGCLTSAPTRPLEAACDGGRATPARRR